MHPPEYFEERKRAEDLRLRNWRTMLFAAYVEGSISQQEFLQRMRQPAPENDEHFFVLPHHNPRNQQEEVEDQREDLADFFQFEEPLSDNEYDDDEDEDEDDIVEIELPVNGPNPLINNVLQYVMGHVNDSFDDPMVVPMDPQDPQEPMVHYRQYVPHNMPSIPEDSSSESEEDEEFIDR